MTRFVGYIAMSIDGRIADAKGGMDWLNQFNDSEVDHGFGAFYREIDAIVMGRKTYDFVAARPIWPYSDVTTYIVTSKMLTHDHPDIETIAPDYDALRRHLAGPDDVKVWVMGGGETQRGALDADMFDEMHLFVMPVVLGSGPLVFADGAMTGAALTDHAILPGGVVRLTYGF